MQSIEGKEMCDAMLTLSWYRLLDPTFTALTEYIPGHHVPPSSSCSYIGACVHSGQMHPLTEVSTYVCVCTCVPMHVCVRACVCVCV